MKSDVNAVAQKNRAKDTESVSEDFQLCRGDFIGVVHGRERKYGFYVRDLRREKPTIHGTGLDFAHAVTAVTQILNALDVRS